MKYERICSEGAVESTVGALLTLGTTEINASKRSDAVFADTSMPGNPPTLDVWYVAAELPEIDTEDLDYFQLVKVEKAGRK